MRDLIHSRSQLLIPQQPERKDKPNLSINKYQGERCSQPAPPIPDLLEQFLETTPVILKRFREETPIVRMMKRDVYTGPKSLVLEIRVSRLFQSEMFLEKLVESLMLK